MTKPKTNRPDDPKQSAAFRKAARDLGCDDNEERFKQALRTVAKAKPSPEKSRRDSSGKNQGKPAKDD